MAETPRPVLTFPDPPADRTCFDCGTRVIDIPGPLPDAGDDFDWRVRDYDGFRQFMLEELAARFPERTRWTPADLEVVLVEVLANALDQLSDMADRVFAEAYLDTARQPSSLRRLLSLIAYDAPAEADALGQIEIDETMTAGEQNTLLERFWAANPHAMDAARIAGRRAIRTQHRMVSVADYAERLEDHPLVLRAQSWTRWTGSWQTLFAAIVPYDTGLTLDDPIPLADDAASERKRRARLQAKIEVFNERRRIPLPVWSKRPTLRGVLIPYVDRYRMTGQEVLLVDAVPVGITLILSIVVNRIYYPAEVRAEAASVLGRGPGGFFAPGRLRFGEDLVASDIIAALMALPGVDTVCLIRFKRAGAQYPDETASGRIIFSGLELAVCDNDPANLARGYLRIRTSGGIGA